MKKLLFLIILLPQACLPTHDNSPKETVGLPVRYDNQQVTALDYQTAGIHFKVLKHIDGGVAVINVTQDSLILSRFKQAFADQRRVK